MEALARAQLEVVAQFFDRATLAEILFLVICGRGFASTFLRFKRAISLFPATEDDCVSKCAGVGSTAMRRSRLTLYRHSLYACNQEKNAEQIATLSKVAAEGKGSTLFRQENVDAVRRRYCGSFELVSLFTGRTFGDPIGAKSTAGPDRQRSNLTT